MNKVPEAILTFLGDHVKTVNESDGIHYYFYDYDTDDIKSTIPDCSDTEFLKGLSQLMNLGYIYNNRRLIRMYPDGFTYYEDNIKKEKIDFSNYA